MQEVEQVKNRDVPWETLLAQFVTGLRRDDCRLNPPNKKQMGVKTDYKILHATRTRICT